MVTTLLRFSDNLTDHEIVVYIPEPEFMVIEEFLVYSAASFAADCGGMGGILLGVSLLALYDAAIANVRLVQKAGKRFFYSPKSAPMQLY